MQSSPARKFPFSLPGTLVLCVLLWALDFPKPMNDDMFYCGAGLNLAQGGGLANPLLARQQFPGRWYFIYPPVYSYALAGWLKIFGISAGAMTGFQLLMYFISAAATIILLRRNAAPVWLEWMAPLAAGAAFLAFGLRPEAFAVALTMTGFALVESPTARLWTVFPGCFLLALGAASAPRTAPFAAALLLLFAFSRFRRGPDYHAKTAACRLLATAGVLAAFLVFLAMIHFQLAEFWRVFRFYAQLVGGSKLRLLALFFTRYLGVTQWPVVAALLVAFTWSLRGKHDRLFRTAMVLAAALPVGFVIGAIGNGTFWYVILMLLLLTASILKNQPAGLRGRALAAVVIGSLLLANIRTFVDLAGILSGNVDSKPSPIAAEIRALPCTPEHPLLIDEPVVR